MTEKLTDNTLPLTPIQTDRIDSSPPMDLSPDVTQMHVESPTKNLTPNILTHASADSPPMDLSPEEQSILSVCIGVRGRVLSFSFSVIVCVYTVDGKYTCGGYGDLFRG
jgi:hypothetical protein